MIENNQWYLHWDLRTICWMPLHNEQARFIGSSSNPLSRLLIYRVPQTKKYQIFWIRSKAKFLNHTHLCSSCLDASNNLQAILLLGHFHTSGTWNDYCLLNWKPLLRLHIISLFLCVLKNLLVCKFWSKKS